MKEKEIDNEISRLVIEKRLLNESLKRNKNELEQKEIKRRIMSLNGEIYRLRRLRSNDFKSN